MIAGMIGRFLRVAALFLMMSSGHALAQDSARTLAVEFDWLADGIAPGDTEKAYAAIVLLQRILTEFPKSLEARLLQTKGRLPNRTTDIAAIYDIAQDWIAAHPEVAPVVLPEILAGQDVQEALPQRAPSGVSAALPPPPEASVALGQLRPKPADLAAALPVARLPGEAEMHRNLRRAAVLLYFVGQTRQGQLVAEHVGSGAFIGPDLVLTNAHVAGARDGYVGTWLAINETIGVRRAQVMSMAPRDTPIKIDAAVLRIDGTKAESWLKLDPNPRLDDRIVIAGYPGDATLLDQRYRVLNDSLVQGLLPAPATLPTALLNEGRINNFITDVESRSSELQYTMVTAAGNSGSPVVNLCGDIVGLHYSGGSTGATVKFNGAVHARDIGIYLQFVGLPVQTATAACPQG